jgi:hypothetical protein
MDKFKNQTYAQQQPIFQPYTDKSNFGHGDIIIKLPDEILCPIIDNEPNSNESNFNELDNESNSNGVNNEPNSNVDNEPNSNVDNEPNSNVDNEPNSNEVSKPNSNGVNNEPNSNVDNEPNSNVDNEPNSNEVSKPNSNGDNEPNSNEVDSKPNSNEVDSKPNSNEVDSKPNSNGSPSYAKIKLSSSNLPFKLEKYSCNYNGKIIECDNSTDGPTLVLSMFLEKDKIINTNFNGDNKPIPNNDFRLTRFANQLKQIIIFKYFFPKSNVQIYFDAHLLNKLETLNANSFFNLQHIIPTKFIYNDLLVDESICKNINDVLHKTYTKLIAIDANNNYMNLKEKFLMYYLLVCLDEPKQFFNFNFYVYYFNMLFDNNSLIGHYIKYISLKQMAYTNTQNKIIQRPIHIIWKCTSYYDIEWITKMNELANTTKIKLYLIPTALVYSKQPETDLIKCEINDKFYFRSTIAINSQFVNSTYSKNFISDEIYMKSFGIAFSLNNTYKLPTLKINDTLQYDPLIDKNYGYHINEYINSAVFNIPEIKKNSIYLKQYSADKIFDKDGLFYKIECMLLLFIGSNNIPNLSQLTFLEEVEKMRSGYKAHTDGLLLLLSIYPTKYYFDFSNFKNTTKIYADIVKDFNSSLLIEYSDINLVNLNNQKNYTEIVNYRSNNLSDKMTFDENDDFIINTEQINIPFLKSIGITCLNSGIATPMEWNIISYFNNNLTLNYKDSLYYSGLYHTNPPILNIGILRNPADLIYCKDSLIYNQLCRRLNNSCYKLLTNTNLTNIVLKNVNEDGIIDEKIIEKIFMNSTIYTLCNEATELYNKILNDRDIKWLTDTSPNKYSILSSYILFLLNYIGYDVNPNWIRLSIVTDKFTNNVIDASQIPNLGEYILYILINADKTKLDDDKVLTELINIYQKYLPNLKSEYLIYKMLEYDKFLNQEIILPTLKQRLKQQNQQFYTYITQLKQLTENLISNNNKQQIRNNGEYIRMCNINIGYLQKYIKTQHDQYITKYDNSIKALNENRSPPTKYYVVPTKIDNYIENINYDADDTKKITDVENITDDDIIEYINNEIKISKFNKTMLNIELDEYQYEYMFIIQNYDIELTKWYYDSYLEIVKGYLYDAGSKDYDYTYYMNLSINSSLNSLVDTEKTYNTALNNYFRLAETNYLQIKKCNMIQQIYNTPVNENDKIYWLLIYKQICNFVNDNKFIIEYDNKKNNQIIDYVNFISLAYKRCKINSTLIKNFTQINNNLKFDLYRELKILDFERKNMVNLISIQNNNEYDLFEYKKLKKNEINYLALINLIIKTLKKNYNTIETDLTNKFEQFKLKIMSIIYDPLKHDKKLIEYNPFEQKLNDNNPLEQELINYNPLELKNVLTRAPIQEPTQAQLSELEIETKLNNKKIDLENVKNNIISEQTKQTKQIQEFKTKYNTNMTELTNYDSICDLLKKKFDMEKEHTDANKELYELEKATIISVYELNNQFNKINYNKLTPDQQKTEHKNVLSKQQELQMNHKKHLAEQTNKLAILEIHNIILSIKLALIKIIFNELVTVNNIDSTNFLELSTAITMLDIDLEIQLMKNQQEFDNTLKKIDFDYKINQINKETSKLHDFNTNNIIDTKKNDYLKRLKKLYCEYNTFLYTQQNNKNKLIDELKLIELKQRKQYNIIDNLKKLFCHYNKYKLNDMLMLDLNNVENTEIASKFNTFKTTFMDNLNKTKTIFITNYKTLNTQIINDLDNLFKDTNTDIRIDTDITVINNAIKNLLNSIEQLQKQQNTENTNYTNTYYSTYDTLIKSMSKSEHVPTLQTRAQIPVPIQARAQPRAPIQARAQIQAHAPIQARAPNTYMVGGTNYEKYLKYKDKYLKLKNSVISNF